MWDKVKLNRHIVAEDCGRMINPMIVDGQVHGAVAQGIGAALLQGLADSRLILATGPVVAHPKAMSLLETSGLKPVAQSRAVRGIADEVAVYEIP
jgi:hypothetical protein